MIRFILFLFFITLLIVGGLLLSESMWNYVTTLFSVKWKKFNKKIDKKTKKIK